MAIDGILCALSKARLEQLESDLDVLAEVVAARHETEIPGLLDVGKAWDALDLMLSDRGSDALLGDALLGRSGRKLQQRGPFSKARILEPARVKELAAALAQLPSDLVRQRYPTLAGREVYGDYGQEIAAEDAPAFVRGQVGKVREREIGELGKRLAALVGLYGEAARKGQWMLTLVV